MCIVYTQFRASDAMATMNQDKSVSVAGANETKRRYGGRGRLNPPALRLGNRPPQSSCHCQQRENSEHALLNCRRSTLLAVAVPPCTKRLTLLHPRTRTADNILLPNQRRCRPTNLRSLALPLRSWPFKACLHFPTFPYIFLQHVKSASFRSL